LAYCLGERGLRLTAAWAAAVGLVDISNVAILGRLQKSSDWLALLVGRALEAAAPKATQGRLIRIIDGTTVSKVGPEARKNNQLWRIHSAFDLPAERFGFFELTDETGGERLDRVPVIRGEIRLADRAFLQPDRMRSIIEDGGDFVIRAGWKAARWLDVDGQPFDIIAELGEAAEVGKIDRSIAVTCKLSEPLAVRLIAIKKPPKAAAEARRRARREAQRGGHKISRATLDAADWVIIVTSLDKESFPTDDVLALYRLRWRVELAFKRLKSLIGLKGPPGKDERSARAWLLAHLLAMLLLEPVIDVSEDSPRLPLAA
jgi:DDE family transposase